MEGSSEQLVFRREPSITVGLLPQRRDAPLNKAVVEQKPECDRKRRECREEECKRQPALRLNRRILHDFVAHAFIECQDEFQGTYQDEEGCAAVSPH